jgi:hypothetical protein
MKTRADGHCSKTSNFWNRGIWAHMSHFMMTANVLGEGRTFGTPPTVGPGSSLHQRPRSPWLPAPSPAGMHASDLPRRRRAPRQTHRWVLWFSLSCRRRRCIWSNMPHVQPLFHSSSTDGFKRSRSGSPRQRAYGFLRERHIGQCP